MKMPILLSILLSGFCFTPANQAAPRSVNVDVAVYTATPSGILAALAVKREGRSVVIIEPSRWVGGILGAGLKPLQDCPNYNATGGLTRTLIKTLGQKGGHLTANGGSLNPRAIRDDFAALLKEQQIDVVYEHRVSKVEKQANQITTATFDLAPFDELGCPPVEPKTRDALQVTAKIFIDASYEGDFLPRAGISYRIGREAAAEFDEPHAGVQPPLELAPIDPFVVPGKHESGLLEWVEADHGKEVGAADGYTQAYNYRYYTTSDPKHRLPITPPANYEAEEFELVGRYVEHLTKTITEREKLRQRLVGICPGWMNSGEWNYQRSSLFSLAPLGISQKYADGDHAEQARVWKQHQEYLRGLFAFMRTDKRVPTWFRDELAEIGLDGRAHPETGGWPHQLYVRVARRLKGRYTVTAHDVYNKTTVEDPICLAQYGIDTYPSRRIWLEKGGKIQVGIEGKMFVGGSRGPTNIPYPIPYRAITPVKEECTNLLVPVSFSATHLGYASARMEPVFMICGESAGIAACHAIVEKSSVQEIDMVSYRKSLTAANQKLHWDPAKDQSTASDNDGKLTFQNLLKLADTDQSGAISQHEWNAAKSSHAWLFEFIDTSKDGQLDRAEYDAFQKYKDEHPDWMKLREKAIP
jgi:hypothetical protein